jgi:hypothetical protein
MILCFDAMRVSQNHQQHKENTVDFYIRDTHGRTFYVDSLEEGIRHLSSEDGYRLTIRDGEAELVLRANGPWEVDMFMGSKNMEASLVVRLPEPQPEWVPPLVHEADPEFEKLLREEEEIEHKVRHAAVADPHCEFCLESGRLNVE